MSNLREDINKFDKIMKSIKILKENNIQIEINKDQLKEQFKNIKESYDSHINPDTTRSEIDESSYEINLITNDKLISQLNESTFSDIMSIFMDKIRDSIKDLKNKDIIENSLRKLCIYLINTLFDSIIAAKHKPSKSEFIQHLNISNISGGSRGIKSDDGIINNFKFSFNIDNDFKNEYNIKRIPVINASFRDKKLIIN